jgi:hypothetical protein
VEGLRELAREIFGPPRTTEPWCSLVKLYGLYRTIRRLKDLLMLLFELVKEIIDGRGYSLGVC